MKTANKLRTGDIVWDDGWFPVQWIGRLGEDLLEIVIRVSQRPRTRHCSGEQDERLIREPDHLFEVLK